MNPREGERHRRILYAAAFLRALAIGLMAVLIGLYAARLGLSAAQIGIVLSCALWGAAFAALATLVFGPRFTERSILVSLTALPLVGGAIFLATDAFWLLALAAFVGMFNVNGRDRGATGACYMRLPHRAGAAVPVGLGQLSPESRPIVRKISWLFFIDAFGGGFVGSALMAYFFAQRFDVGAAHVALLFAVGRVLSALSHLAAAWLAKRIGLVNTMIYTHVPSCLLLSPSSPRTISRSPPSSSC
jgi:hypothetical protein